MTLSPNSRVGLRSLDSRQLQLPKKQSSQHTISLGEDVKLDYQRKRYLSYSYKAVSVIHIIFVK